MSTLAPGYGACAPTEGATTPAITTAANASVSVFISNTSLDPRRDGQLGCVDGHLHEHAVVLRLGMDEHGEVDDAERVVRWDRPLARPDVLLRAGGDRAV